MVLRTGLLEIMPYLVVQSFFEVDDYCSERIRLAVHMTIEEPFCAGENCK